MNNDYEQRLSLQTLKEELLRIYHYYNELRNQQELRIQLETALCIINCFCNTELRTANRN